MKKKKKEKPHKLNWWHGNQNDIGSFDRAEIRMNVLFMVRSPK